MKVDSWGYLDNLAISGALLFYTRTSAQAPDEIFRRDLPNGDVIPDPSAEPQQVTHMNDALLSQIDIQPMESFTFKGADNADVQGFMIKPPGFDASKKYPLKFLIHGGPQGRGEMIGRIDGIRSCSPLTATSWS